MFRHSVSLLAFIALAQGAVGCAAPVADDAAESNGALSSPPSGEREAPGTRDAVAFRRRLRDAYLATIRARSRADFVATPLPKDDQGNDLRDFVQGLQSPFWAANYEYFEWRGQEGPSGGPIYLAQSRNVPAAFFLRDANANATLTVVSFVHLRSRRNLRGEMTTGQTRQTVYYADAETVLYAIWPSGVSDAEPRFFVASSVGQKLELDPSERPSSPPDGDAARAPAK